MTTHLDNIIGSGAQCKKLKRLVAHGHDVSQCAFRLPRTAAAWRLHRNPERQIYEVLVRGIGKLYSTARRDQRCSSFRNPLSRARVRMSWIES
mmetsp:Transcript_9755/g.19062  ORF Transcript_9755/g.19062 Transcript_9755/m.19062 type:complete len:93 (-) Transcript_9755:545-823(-)